MALLRKRGLQASEPVGGQRLEKDKRRARQLRPPVDGANLGNEAILVVEPNRLEHRWSSLPSRPLKAYGLPLSVCVKHSEALLMLPPM